MQIVDILPAYNFIFTKCPQEFFKFLRLKERKDEKTNTDIFVC